LSRSDAAQEAREAPGTIEGVRKTALLRRTVQRWLDDLEVQAGPDPTLLPR